ncbi:MAG: glycosyltransferase, partial [Nodosilinea sp.]
LAEQTYTGPWEIIVADNGSSDRTLEIAKQYQQQLPQLQIIDASARKGAAYARNAASAKAKGDVLLFCDADDEVTSGWLAAMDTGLKEHDFVCGWRETDKLNTGNSFSSALASVEGQGLLYHPFKPFASASNLGVRKVHHEAVGGFDEQFLNLQDIDYCWRLQELGITLHQVEEAVVNFRFRGDLASNFRRLRRFGYYSACLYRKHWANGFPKKMLLRCFLSLFSVPAKFVARVRDRNSLFLWLLNLGWSLGYWHGWIDIAKDAVVGQLNGGRTDSSLPVSQASQQ